MNDEDLLDLIYQAAADPREWVRVTAELSDKLGGAASVLYDRPVPGRQQPLSVTVELGYDAGAQDEMRRHFCHIDVRVQQARKALTGHVYVDDRDVAFSEIAGSEIHNDYYRPRGIGHVGAVVLARGAEQFSILSVHRAAAFGPFRSEERALLDRLSPHLVRAWRMAGKLRETAETAQALASAVDVIRAKIFVLRADGTVAHMSTDAEELVRRGDRLRIANRRLVALNRTDDEALQNLIATSIARPTIDVVLPPAMTVIRGARPLSLFAVPQPGSLNAAALLFASDSAETPPAEADLLRAQFGFTWAEARAVAALTEGIDTPAIAARFGVSVETIRSQVKSAQAKCGAKSQAGLALMAQRSLAVLRRGFT